MNQEAELVIYEDYVNAMPNYTNRYLGHIYVGGERYALYGRNVTVAGLWIFKAIWENNGTLREELDDYWYIGNLSKLLNERFVLPVSIVRVTYSEQTLNQYESLEATGHIDMYLAPRVLNASNLDQVDGGAMFNKIARCHLSSPSDILYRYVHRTPVHESVWNIQPPKKKKGLIEKILNIFRRGDAKP